MNFQFFTNGKPTGTVFFPGVGQPPLVSNSLWGIIDRLPPRGSCVMPFVDPTAFQHLLAGLAAAGPIVCPYRGVISIVRQ